VIFSHDMVPKVLTGEKTVTRRPVKRDRDGMLKPCRYKVGSFYAVQERRGGRAFGRITIVETRRDVILQESFTDAEARLEGFRNAIEFWFKWKLLYGDDHPVDVWRIEFRRVAPD
jgi:hypothetical protein